MLVWLIASDGTFVDEINVDTPPTIGESITVDKAYEVIGTPEQDDNAKKLDAQILIVKEA